MKKILQSIAFLMIIAVILPSCMKQMSVTKRRYNKGYYIAHSHKPSEVKTNTHQPKTQEGEPAAKTSTERVAESKSNTDNDQLIAETALDEANKLAKTQETRTITKEKKKNSGESINGFSAGKNPFSQDRMITAMQKGKQIAAGSDAAGDVLSLFWIIILIILLLYLVGLLFDGFGLGWAIHILALIVLILLILWLLRVV